MKLAACFSQAEQAAGMIPRGLAPESDPPPILAWFLSSLLGEPLTLFTKCKRSKLGLLSCPSSPNPSLWRGISVAAHSYSRSDGGVHRRAPGLIPEWEVFWEAGTLSDTGTWRLGFWL